MTGIRPVPDEPTATSAPARSSENQVLADLLQRAGRGDQEAFAGVYDAVASRLHGLVLRVVRDPAQAEEVTQEAMVEIWRQSARFDPALGSPLSWLMTIAHRRAVDRVRSAEATSRRDTSYHQQNQVTEHDSTAEEATTTSVNIDAATVPITVRAVSGAIFNCQPNVASIWLTRATVIKPAKMLKTGRIQIEFRK